MKYLKQFMIIIAVSFVGELMHYYIPLPIPASIYGLVIMFISLCTGLIKLEAVKSVAMFLIEIMPVMFIPAGVGLMQSWGVLKESLVPVVSITIVSTIVVMATAGWVTQLVIRAGRRHDMEVQNNE